MANGRTAQQTVEERALERAMRSMSDFALSDRLERIVSEPDYFRNEQRDALIREAARRLIAPED
jgi:hypothetical protein